MTDKNDIDGYISDLVSDFLYYDRKGDSDLPVGTIEEMVEDNRITIDDMVESFRLHLTGHINNYRL